MTEHVRFVRRCARMLSVPVVVGAMMASSTVALAVRPDPEATGTTPSCTLTTTGVGQPLVLSGAGFASDSQYVLFTATPSGSGGTTINTDSTGSLSYTTVAGWPGTYTDQIWSERHKSTEVATCSVTIS